MMMMMIEGFWATADRGRNHVSHCLSGLFSPQVNNVDVDDEEEEGEEDDEDGDVSHGGFGELLRRRCSNQ